MVRAQDGKSDALCGIERGRHRLAKVRQESREVDCVWHERQRGLGEQECQWVIWYERGARVDLLAPAAGDDYERLPTLPPALIQQQPLDLHSQMTGKQPAGSRCRAYAHLFSKVAGCRARREGVGRAEACGVYLLNGDADAALSTTSSKNSATIWRAATSTKTMHTGMASLLWLICALRHIRRIS